MNKGKLAQAIREKAELLRVCEVTHGDGHDMSGLLNVLARIVEGRPLLLAFGAPGDWGYHQPIGAALVAKEDPPALGKQGLELLTPMQRKVFEKLVEGKTNRAVGVELGISEKTVAVHLWGCRVKLGGGSVAAMAARCGLTAVPVGEEAERS